MKKLLLIVGGLSVLGYGLYRYFKTQGDLLNKFTWKVSGFKIINLSLTELSANVDFLFTSVSDIEAKVEKLYLDLYINNVNVGFVSEDKSFIIPARGSSTIPIHVSINPKVVLSNLIDLTFGSAKNKDVMFKLNGFANVKSGFISTTLPITYETSIKQYLKV
jgi:hypothetical protein